MPDVPIILALDLASRVGFAIGSADRAPIFGAVQLPKTGADVGSFIVAYEDWLSEMLDRIKAATTKAKTPERRVIVCFEKSVLPPQTQIQTLIKLYGLCSETERFCKRAGAQCREAHMGSVRKFFVGKGNAKKPETIAAAREAGFKLDYDQDDEADAIATHAYASNMIAKDRGWYSLGRIGGVMERIENG